MPNPWDIGTTRLLTGLGYEALATTSAGLAYSLGRRDGEAAVTREEALEHAARSPERPSCRSTATSRTGSATIPRASPRRSAEPRRPGSSAARSRTRPPHPGDRSIRSPGGRAHQRQRGGGCRPAVLVHAHGARRELPARPQRPRRHDRAAPGLRQGGRRRPLCTGAARHRRHPHGLCGGLEAGQRTRAPGAPSVELLSAAGVRRVSLGTGLVRTALGAFLRAARDVREHGTFGCLDGAATSEDLKPFLERARIRRGCRAGRGSGSRISAAAAIIASGAGG